jgi:tetratricopeptide (TPR) repeat protein
VWIGRAHHGRGRCLSRLGRREEAWAEVETVRKMIDAGGEEGKQYLPAWHFLAGYVKLEADEAEAALEHLGQAGPQHDPHRTFLMARAEERLGRKDEARKHYQEVVDSRRMGPDAAAAYDEARKRLEALSAPAEAKR